ncbi:MAG: hypothetical protein KH295_02620 [Clostridiaceae bacterium]|nr:hypothetical protein [Clostridiaceae bacterium]
MKDFVRFGVILHHIATVAGWVFCLVLLAHPEERSLVGFALLIAWTFVQTIGTLELIGRWLLGRLDEKEERMQRSFARLGEHLGEDRAKGVFGVTLVAMVALKLALPVGLNRI